MLQAPLERQVRTPWMDMLNEMEWAALLDTLVVAHKVLKGVHQCSLPPSPCRT